MIKYQFKCQCFLVELIVEEERNKKNLSLVIKMIWLKGNAVKNSSFYSGPKSELQYTYI